MVTMEDTMASIMVNTTAAIMDIITARSHQINHSRKQEKLHQQERILTMLLSQSKDRQEVLAR